MKCLVVMISLLCAQPIVAGALCQQLHSYFMANYEHYKNDAPKAHEWYKKTFELGSPVYANKGLVHFLYDTSNDGLILQLAPSLDNSFKEDTEIQFILAQAFANTGKQEEADKRLIELNNKIKNHPEIAFQTVQTYVQRKEPENALKVIDNYLNNAVRKQQNFVFHFVKSQILLELDKKDEALASIKISLELQPRFDKGWLLQALLEERAGRLKEAIKGYTTFLDIVGTHKEIEQHLIALVFKQSMLEQNNPNIDISPDCLKQVMQLFNQKKFHQALELLEKCLKQAPTHEARLLKIQILMAMHNHDQALTDLKEFISQYPNEPLFFTTLQLLQKDGITADRIIKTLHDIEKKSETALLPTLFLAELYIQEDNTHAALTYLHKALDLTHDPHLKTTLLYQMGIIYYEAKQFKQLKKVLAAGYELDKTYIPLINLYAYFMATKEGSFDRAQELISQALAHDAHNPHLLDTQAVIFLKQKQYAKALDILEPLAVQEPQDRTIMKHLAKAHYYLNHTNQALACLDTTIALTFDDKKQKKYQKIKFSWTTKK